MKDFTEKLIVLFPTVSKWQAAGGRGRGHFYGGIKLTKSRGTVLGRTSGMPTKNNRARSYRAA